MKTEERLLHEIDDLANAETRLQWDLSRGPNVQRREQLQDQLRRTRAKRNDLQTQLEKLNVSIADEVR